jgi:hypothetical protein
MSTWNNPEGLKNTARGRRKPTPGSHTCFIRILKGFHPRWKGLFHIDPRANTAYAVISRWGGGQALAIEGYNMKFVKKTLIVALICVSPLVIFVGVPYLHPRTREELSYARRNRWLYVTRLALEEYKNANGLYPNEISRLLESNPNSELRNVITQSEERGLKYFITGDNSWFLSYPGRDGISDIQSLNDLPTSPSVEKVDGLLENTYGFPTTNPDSFYVTNSRKGDIWLMKTPDGSIWSSMFSRSQLRSVLLSSETYVGE